EVLEAPNTLQVWLEGRWLVHQALIYLVYTFKMEWNETDLVAYRLLKGLMDKNRVALATFRYPGLQLVHANPAYMALLQIDQAAIDGHTLNSLGVTIDELALPNILSGLESHGAAILEQTRVDLPTGQQIRVSGHAQRIDLAGQDLVMMALLNHWEYVKSLQREVEGRRIAMIGAFIDDMAHDLRTPLTNLTVSQHLLSAVLNNMLKDLQQVPKGDPAPKELVSLLRADLEKASSRASLMELSLERLRSVIHQMLDLARLNELQVINPELIDVNEMLNTLALRYQRKLDNKGLRVALKLDGSVLMLRLDPVIELALASLLENAIYFTPPGGRIEVRSSQEDHQVLIEIEDTGIGIAPDDLPFVKQAFFRADHARSTHTGGSGLGLAIADRAISQNQGQLLILSRLGEGTIARVCLHQRVIHSDMVQ
ncbi:MAG: hypothetical protein GYB68_17970, partial [Chloroflexi bacterium]|nr:hypothetical protein [Chloroflexota bacterium]